MEGPFELSLVLEDGYRFRVDFAEPGVPSLHLDEPEPPGSGRGPNAARLLAAAVGNCLASSALFCLRKARIPVEEMRVEVRGRIERNDDGRLRIGGLDVALYPTVPSEAHARTGRCLDLFEAFCLVTQSVREGIDVDVDVTFRTPAEAAPAGDA